MTPLREGRRGRCRPHVLSASLIGACILATPDAVGACTLLAVAEQVVVSYQIPAGGDVPLICMLDACTMESASVIEMLTDEPVAGSVIRTGIDDLGRPWAIFRPDVPLAAGTLLTGRLGGDRRGYEVVSEDPSVLGEFTDEAHVEDFRTFSGPSACCEPMAGSCNFDPPCFHENTLVSAALWLAPGGGAPTAASQWLFKVTVTADGMDPVEGAWFPGISRARVVLSVEKPTYCFTLHAESLQTGAQRLVQSDCVTSEVAFGADPIPHSQDGETLAVCSAPPVGFEAAWCEALSHCERSPGDTRLRPFACNLADEVCGFAVADAGPMPMAPQMREDGGSSPEAETLPNEGDGSLCDLRPASPNRAPRYWLALALAALGARSVRKPARGSKPEPRTRRR